MKKVLIISPHFAPVNAADMHRVRQSLPFFRDYGWEPVVVAVDPVYIETSQDQLLLHTVPEEVEVIRVKAFATKYTRKLGLGSLALRSMWFYFREVNFLLEQRKFDLIYFSTTMFPIPILGRLWKKRFGVPYVIDMQDPWFNNYYLSKPKQERPPKFWFSYRLNQLTEPVAMKKVDGIIAVSEAYHKTLQRRYKNIRPEKCLTLTFGAFDKDFEVLKRNDITNPFFDSHDGLIHIPYVGAVGDMMKFSISAICMALKIGLKENPSLFTKVRLYFIGTSYAAEGTGKKTVESLSIQYEVSDHVVESPDRIPYFQALRIIKDANMLLIAGSDNPQYTASKLYNYILADKPMLAIFREESSVVKILQKTKAGKVVGFRKNSDLKAVSEQIYTYWKEILTASHYSKTDWEAFQSYTARVMTQEQTNFFDHILQPYNIHKQQLTKV